MPLPSPARPADRRCDQAPLAIHELRCRHLTPAGCDHIRTLGEPLGPLADLAHDGTLHSRSRELLKHRTLIEGVALSRQAIGAGQVVGEAPLRCLPPLDQAAYGALPALPDELGELL